MVPAGERRPVAVLGDTDPAERESELGLDVGLALGREAMACGGVQCREGTKMGKARRHGGKDLPDEPAHGAQGRSDVSW
jgi:hypothetical protein